MNDVMLITTNFKRKNIKTDTICIYPFFQHCLPQERLFSLVCLARSPAQGTPVWELAESC